MNNDYIPEEVLEWREKNKHLFENRNKKPLHEILQNLNDWINQVEQLFKENKK